MFCAPLPCGITQGDECGRGVALGAVDFLTIVCALRVGACLGSFGGCFPTNEMRRRAGEEVFSIHAEIVVS